MYTITHTNKQTQMYIIDKYIHNYSHLHTGINITYTHKHSHTHTHTHTHSNLVIVFSDVSDCEFTCANGQCVELNDTCDGINHCEDGSDEMCCKGVCVLRHVCVCVCPCVSGVHREDILQ